MSQLLKSAHLEWIADSFTSEKAVAFTLNFRQRSDGILLTQKTAADTIRRFNHALCRRAFGSRKASRCTSDFKLNWIAVFEGKASRHRADTQLHCHGLVEVPEGLSIDAWKKVCAEQWRSLKWADSTSFELVNYQTPGFIKYMLKNRTKEDWAQAIDLDTLHLSPSRSTSHSPVPLSFHAL
ncbi:MAG: hypothetical protein EON54_01570 [Alcaligenaceae bacterium]|nr:MAG: hypothetical protein EON54_01570 [Alcaligenaceae bacterium]